MYCQEDRPLPPKGIAAMFGVTAEFVRAACHRGPSYHPLPHTASGEVRPVLRIRPSVFAKWYEEEELAQAGAAR